MKKAFAAMSLVAVLLTGCAADEQLGRLFLERAGVTSQQEYLRYEQYREMGLLDEEGYYVMPRESEQEHNGQIHVTFATNRYMEILYYTDAAMISPLTASECYLDPGDTLYAKLGKYNEPNSNLYRLAEYRIREYDAEGKVKEEQVVEATGDVMEYQIPADFTGTELSVLPVGAYEDRELSMDAYYVDDSGEKHPLGNAGIWFINDDETVGNTVRISPIEPYVLKFVYDKENYFYVSSEPACFTRDPVSTGSVEFWEAEPTDENTAYSVELHLYLNLSLKCSEEARIRKGQDEARTMQKNKVWNAENLSYGDIIVVETKGECKIESGDYRHLLVTKDPISNGYRYTFTVTREVQDSLPDIVDIDRVFDVVLDDKGDYGTCTYKLDGKVVLGAVQLKESQKLTLTYKITQDNYTFAEESEGGSGFFANLFQRDERTVDIPITADLDGTTIDPDDWVKVQAKGA